MLVAQEISERVKEEPDVPLDVVPAEHDASALLVEEVGRALAAHERVAAESLADEVDSVAH